MIRRLESHLVNDPRVPMGRTLARAQGPFLSHYSYKHTSALSVTDTSLTHLVHYSLKHEIIMTSMGMRVIGTIGERPGR